MTMAVNRGPLQTWLIGEEGMRAGRPEPRRIKTEFGRAATIATTDLSDSELLYPGLGPETQADIDSQTAADAE
ncbi:hypothetical protein PPACK8108_LOCUS3912 [Phakopsora pachyrhizi]|uniref:Uncharacterized protein n=1 Tax=Phakopsora pachyrhizi TaxID=170000 RepID=A0AAV0AMU6_PHAPC|nr:hypothetical protein PPACK8108_LOCUS3912 [Phakopsora pachyrhizi]